MRQEKKNQRGITSAIFSAVFDSRSSFFAPKPHGNACYVGYLYLFLIGLHLPSRNCPYTMFVFVHFENESMCYLCEIYRSHDLLRPHPHVSAFVWKQRFFSPVWPTVHTFPVKMVTENAYYFSKTLKKTLQSAVKVSDSACFSLGCGRTKMEVFEYDDIIHHLLLV